MSVIELRAHPLRASLCFVLETQASQRASRPRVVLRLDELDRITTALGYDTDAARAAFLGISPAALSKIRNGRHLPSADLIAAVRTALPRVPYESLFTTEER